MIARATREALEEALGDAVRFDVPMSRYTSLRVGGPADALATPSSRADLARLLAVCMTHRLRHAILGAGFNTLALDHRIEGVVIQMGGLRRLEERPGGLLRAEAGVSHAQLTNFCCRRGLAGLEFGAGIPGSVGGWLAMNAGIPGREMKDVVHEVEVMSPTGRRVSHLRREALRFVYRALRGLAPGSVLLSTLLEVEVAQPAAVRAEVKRLLAKRAGTQPLDVPTCGSVFKNPPGDFAGRLIDAAGLKGRRIGGAQISPLHANFISNLGGATAADILALMEEARAAVKAATQTRLETEVRLLGRKG
ncbi:MAG: UDP-N-acetylmuramate dehydrogenase [Myxococcales bacterium]|nr:UDP-N-acetylmuramate dehydrogenase [Myxococcales bacterium]